MFTANPDGTFTAKLPFPNAENSTGFEKWTDGSQHEINFLSGSLQKGDAAKHSVTLNVTIGDAPATAEDPKDDGQQDNGQQPGNPSANDTKKLEPQPTEPPAPDHQMTVTPALSLAQQIIRAVLRNRVHKIMHLHLLHLLLSLRLRLRPTVMLP